MLPHVHVVSNIAFIWTAFTTFILAYLNWIEETNPYNWEQNYEAASWQTTIMNPEGRTNRPFLSFTSALLPSDLLAKSSKRLAINIRLYCQDFHFCDKCDMNNIATNIDVIMNKNVIFHKRHKRFCCCPLFTWTETKTNSWWCTVRGVGCVILWSITMF